MLMYPVRIPISSGVGWEWGWRSGCGKFWMSAADMYRQPSAATTTI